jgi:hypothetical protein
VAIIKYQFILEEFIRFLGDEERRLMDLVPALAVRLMKRRVLSRPGVYSLHLRFHSEKVNASPKDYKRIHPSLCLSQNLLWLTGVSFLRVELSKACFYRVQPFLVAVDNKNHQILYKLFKRQESGAPKEPTASFQRLNNGGIPEGQNT